MTDYRMNHSYSLQQSTTSAQCTSTYNPSGPDSVEINQYTTCIQFGGHAMTCRLTQAPFSVATSHTEVQCARLDLLVVCNLHHIALLASKVERALHV